MSQNVSISIRVVTLIHFHVQTHMFINILLEVSLKTCLLAKAIQTMSESTNRRSKMPHQLDIQLSNFDFKLRIVDLKLSGTLISETDIE